MFRGLTSWFGLEQPAAGGLQYQGDGQPKGDAPPEQRSEAVADSAEGELQQAGDQELLHQAKGLGSESPPASGTTEFRRAPASHLLPPLGVGHQWSGVWGGERKVCLSVGPLGTGEVDEDLGKAEASSSSQILCLKFLVTCHSLQSVSTLGAGPQ